MAPNTFVMPPEFAVGQKVQVRGYAHEGLRTIVAHYPDIAGGVRLDKTVARDGGPFSGEFFVSWNIDALISETELKLVARFREQEEAYNAASKEIENFFMPRVHAALKDGNVAEARSFTTRCPDSVTRSFIFDALRNLPHPNKRGEDLKTRTMTLGSKTLVYETISVDDVPSTIFSAPAQYQSQTVLLTWGQPGRHGECGLGDLYMREEDRAAHVVTYYRLKK